MFCELNTARLESSWWRLRANSGLCADSIPNGMVERARFLGIKGPNMRKYTACLKRAGDESYWA